MDIRDDRIRFLRMNLALEDIRTFGSTCIEGAERTLVTNFTLNGTFQHRLLPHVPPVQSLHKESFEGNGFGLTHRSVQDRHVLGYPNLRTCIETGRPDHTFAATVPDADPSTDAFHDALSQHLLQLEATLIEHMLIAIHCLGGNAARPEAPNCSLRRWWMDLINRVRSILAWMTSSTSSSRTRRLLARIVRANLSQDSCCTTFLHSWTTGPPAFPAYFLFTSVSQETGWAVVND